MSVYVHRCLLSLSQASTHDPTPLGAPAAARKRGATYLPGRPERSQFLCLPPGGRLQRERWTLDLSVDGSLQLALGPQVLGVGTAHAMAQTACPSPGSHLSDVAGRVLSMLLAHISSLSWTERAMRGRGPSCERKMPKERGLASAPSKPPCVVKSQHRGLRKV